jgi:outer membrane protein
MAESDLDDALEGLAAVTGKKISDLRGLKTTKATGDIKDSAASSNLVMQSGLTRVEMPLVKPDPDSAGEWEEAAGKQNLQVKVMEQKVMVADKEVARQKSEHYPTLNLVGTYNRDAEGGSLYGGDSDLSTREAILQLNIPIYQGGSVSSRVREAKRLADAARNDLEKEVRLAKREARAAFLGVKSAITNTDALMQSLVSFQIALESKKEGFKSGLFPSLSVVDAERDLYSAKKDYSSSQYEYILNGLRLQKATGTLSPEDLEGVNKWLK